MKNSIKTLAALAIFGFAGTAFAQNSAFTTGTATGTLIAPIAITPLSGMTLGNTVAGVAGTVGTPGSTAPSYSPAGLNPGSSQDGTLADAVFTVTGAAGYTFSITTGAATMTGGAGAATGVSLALNTVNGSGTCHPVSGVGQIPLGGSGTFNVGGLASFIIGDVAGTTNATWTETVAYN
jgi:hypothetical protein